MCFQVLTFSIFCEIFVHVVFYIGSYHHQLESNVHLPTWVHGRWLTVGTNGLHANTVYINDSQLLVKTNNDQTVVHDLKFTRLMTSKRANEQIIRIKAKSMEQW